MIPFPNLTAEFRNGKTYIRLPNQELAKMLKKAIEQQGQEVANVEVYPDCFVVTVTFEDFEKKLREVGLDAKFDPKEIKIIVERKALVEQFAKQFKDLEVRDERDYILIVGSITGTPPPFVRFVDKP